MSFSRSVGMVLISLCLTANSASGQSWWEKNRSNTPEPEAEPYSVDEPTPQAKPELKPDDVFSEDTKTSPEAQSDGAQDDSDAPQKKRSEVRRKKQPAQDDLQEEVAPPARAQVNEDAVPETRTQRGEDSVSETPTKVRDEIRTETRQEIRSTKRPQEQEPLPELEKPRPRKIKKAGTKKTRKRAVASIEDSETEVAAPKRKRSNDNNLFRIMALGGYTPSSSTPVGDGSSSAATSILTGGINLDLQLHYFGAEVEGTYGVGAGSVVSGASTTAFTLKNNTLYGAVKGQLPFFTGSVRWVPKLGIGYTTFTETIVQTDLATNVTTSENSISGIYAVAGFQMIPCSWLVIDIDYSRTVSGSGSNTSALAATDPTVVKYDAASLARIRAGAIFRLSKHFDLGAQFIQRSIGFTASGTASTESQTQILGMLGLEW